MKYSVAIMPRITVRIDDIEADTQEEAVAKAVAHYHDHQHEIVDCTPLHAKWVEAREDEREIIALVDDQGDEEYDNSAYFYYLDDKPPKCIVMTGDTFTRLDEANTKFFDAEVELNEKEEERSK